MGMGPLTLLGAALFPASPAAIPWSWDSRLFVEPPFSRTLSCCSSLPRPLTVVDSIAKSCAHWREKRQLLSQNQFRKFTIPSRILRSYEPQETRSNSVSGGKDKLLIDCGPEEECVLGGVVALGKFDALHIGHRQLAIQAAKVGVPFLLSFVGIAEVLGWEYRAPIVAKCDRKRVLSSWAHYCGNVPQEYGVNFATVRYLSPRQFVERLAVDLGVSGVVAGENYRFGYKASGDASDLVKLCEEYSLEAYIVSPVMDDHLICHNGTSAYPSNREKVSSTRVRHALAMGDMEYVEQLLGRKHRLVLAIGEGCFSGNKLSIAKSCMLNQPPKEGLYENCSLLIDDKFVGRCRVIHDSENIHVEIYNKIGSSQRSYIAHESISIEFV